MFPIRNTVKRIERFIIYRILHVDDTPHRLALGIALGIFVAWTPTIGFQMILVLMLAPLIKANGRVGIPVVWVSNPLTMAFIYYPNYLVGRTILNVFIDRPKLTYEHIAEAPGRIKDGTAFMLQHLFDLEAWSNLGRHLLRLLNLSLDLWVGSILVGLFLAAIVYVISYRFIVWYRTHSPLFHLHLRERLRLKKEHKEQAE